MLKDSNLGNCYYGGEEIDSKEIYNIPGIGDAFRKRVISLLYAQERALRSVKHQEDGTILLNFGKGYNDSLNMIGGNNCFSTALFAAGEIRLTGENVSYYDDIKNVDENGISMRAWHTTQIRFQDLNDLHNQGYRKIPIEKAQDLFSFPFFCIAGVREEPIQSPYLYKIKTSHAFIVLGRKDSGEFICFEQHNGKGKIRLFKYPGDTYYGGNHYFRKIET